MNSSHRRTSRPALGQLAMLLIAAGCQTHGEVHFDPSMAEYQAAATAVEYPDVEVETRPDLIEMVRPRTVRTTDPLNFRDMTLDEAIHAALTNSEIMRQIGGKILNPDSGVGSGITRSAQSVHDVAIGEADPRLGPEAALSAFDAQLTSSLFFNRNERIFNNFFFGGGALALVQNTAAFSTELSKRAATGSQFAIRKQIDYDRNNSPASRFPGSYNTFIEGEVRHPLAQGAGIEYNRIAGPNATAGNYNGVILARINTDIRIADFEAAVIKLVYDVERLYWDLYYAYYHVDLRIRARDSNRETWDQTRIKFDAGVTDGEKEALAREQYYQAKELAEETLSGRNTTTTSGLLSAERRLRYLIGMPTNDDALIRPSDRPLLAEFTFDWQEAVHESLARRVELRQQLWQLKLRELELTAAKNFIRPQLDLVAQYRWRGFGDDLLGNNGTRQNSAMESLYSDQLEEWQLGLQFSTPLGRRQGFAAIRHAEFQLAKDRALYRELESEVVNDLTSSVAEIDRAYVILRTRYNRKIAAEHQLSVIKQREDRGLTDLEFTLAAQRRVTEADISYWLATAEYAKAITNFQRARGNLLQHHQVYLSEGPWSAESHASAAWQAQRFRPRHLNYVMSQPHPVSGGEWPQEVLPADGGSATAPEEIPTPLPAIPEE